MFSYSSIVFWIYSHELFHKLAKIRYKCKSCLLSCCYFNVLYFISSYILVMDALCCVNLEDGEVFGTFILAKLRVMLL
jgi:hypothetical protein